MHADLHLVARPLRQRRVRRDLAAQPPDAAQRRRHAEAAAHHEEAILLRNGLVVQQLGDAGEAIDLVVGGLPGPPVAEVRPVDGGGGAREAAGGALRVVRGPDRDAVLRLHAHRVRLQAVEERGGLEDSSRVLGVLVQRGGLVDDVLERQAAARPELVGGLQPRRLHLGPQVLEGDDVEGPDVKSPLLIPVVAPLGDQGLAVHAEALPRGVHQLLLAVVAPQVLELLLAVPPVHHHLLEAEGVLKP
mmetsp:Transcript_73009/g.191386  ORF Transcript_73009/g.191386 Transcript_73009/m.191386 type:complete len:246 (+) Transcript_73009:928-1665(+)